MSVLSGQKHQASNKQIASRLKLGDNSAMDISVHLNPERKVLPKDKLEFGVHFTDHMFLADFESEQGWTNPRIVPYGPLSLDPSCGALHYGQSMFEGMKAFRQIDNSIALFRPDFHFERMFKGASRLCMQAPPPELMKAALKKLLEIDQHWVPGGPGTSLYIRPTLFASEGFLGVRPSKKLTFMIILSPAASYYGANDYLKIWIERHYVRASQGGLGAVKAAANYVAGLKAAVEAKEKGYHQVLWTDARTHEHIEEVGTMNVFFRFNDEVVTPIIYGTLLAGCTRDCVIQLLREWKIPVNERKLTLAEVQERAAKGELLEVFGSGTAASISPIGEFGDEKQTLVLPKNFELAHRLKNQITDIQYGRTSHHSWIEKIVPALQEEGRQFTLL